MKKIARIAVLREFERYLASQYGKVQKEVVFSSFMPTQRKFRADYLVQKSIIEINGGQWVNGRHNQGGAGYETDLSKMNLAQACGFRYFQFTYEQLLRREYKRYL